MTTALYSPDSPMFNSASASQAQVTAYILARKHGEYNDHDIKNVIVPGYFRLCLEIGMEPVMVLAQVIHETGCLSSWWSQRPRRNPAGIGVTGADKRTKPPSGAWVQKDAVWIEGVSFGSWLEDAIPAHLGRLLAYALPAKGGTARQRELIDASLKIRSLPADFRGKAPTWRGLNGRWADPGTTYATQIAAIANAVQRTRA